MPDDHENVEDTHARHVRAQTVALQALAFARSFPTRSGDDVLRRRPLRNLDRIAREALKLVGDDPVGGPAIDDIAVQTSVDPESDVDPLTYEDAVLLANQIAATLIGVLKLRDTGTALGLSERRSSTLTIRVNGPGPDRGP